MKIIKLLVAVVVFSLASCLPPEGVTVSHEGACCEKDGIKVCTDGENVKGSFSLSKKKGEK